jgi:hypothetical protein
MYRAAGAARQEAVQRATSGRPSGLTAQGGEALLAAAGSEHAGIVLCAAPAAERLGTGVLEEIASA